MNIFTHIAATAALSVYLIEIMILCHRTAQIVDLRWTELGIILLSHLLIGSLKV